MEWFGHLNGMVRSSQWNGSIISMELQRQLNGTAPPFHCNRFTYIAAVTAVTLLSLQNILIASALTSIVTAVKAENVKTFLRGVSCKFSPDFLFISKTFFTFALKYCQ